MSFWPFPPVGYIDLHDAGSDSRFYGAFLHVFLVTTLFILAGAWFILRLNPRKASAPRRRRPGFAEIAEPFQNRSYRVFLHASFMLSMVGTMITAFINPYLLGPQNLSMFQISLITVLVSTMGVGLRRLWGHLCDEHGGKNVLRISVVGVAVALFVLTGKGLIPVLIYAVMAWNVTEGLFGVGLFTGQQYLSLALSDGERTNVYIAATSFANGTGMFAGSLLGGFFAGLAGRSDTSRSSRRPLRHLLHLLRPVVPGRWPFRHRAAGAQAARQIHGTGTENVPGAPVQDAALAIPTSSTLRPPEEQETMETGSGWR